MKSLGLIILIFVSYSISLNAQMTFQPDRLSYEKVNLNNDKYRQLESNFKIVDINIAGKKCFSFLGSYDDWTEKHKYIWLSFNRNLNEEFSDYFQQTLKIKDDAQKVSLSIHEFMLKQYLFFNPKGCYFRFEYELYYYKDNRRYSYFLKDTFKIKNVKKASEVLDQIKLSIDRLLKDLILNDFRTRE